MERKIEPHSEFMGHCSTRTPGIYSDYATAKLIQIEFLEDKNGFGTTKLYVYYSVLQVCGFDYVKFSSHIHTQNTSLSSSSNFSFAVSTTAYKQISTIAPYDP